MESTLAGLLSLAISFLAGFLGLGNIASKILGVIQKVRAAVDKAIDTAIAWIVTKAKALFAKLFGKKEKPDEKDPKGSVATIQALQEDLKNRNRDINSAEEFKNMVGSVADSHPGLSAIRVRKTEEGQYVIEASASPFTFIGFVGEYVRTDYGSVVGTVAFDGVLFGEPAYSGGGMHAEDKIIGFVNTRLMLLTKQHAQLPQKVEVYVSCKVRAKTKCSRLQFDWFEESISDNFNLDSLIIHTGT